MASISRELSRWVCDLRPQDLTPAVTERACAVTLQALSSALLGAGTPEAQLALRAMKDEESGGSSTVLVEGCRLTRAGAAFVNSESIFAGGKWDTYRMVTHPGSAVIPAALAAAEATACSGREFLTGVAAGYEVMQRLASDFVPTLMSRGFHAGPVFGIFGAATAAAKIWALDADQLHGALAQCVNLASGNLEGARSGGRSLREGAAVRNALLAVALARQGVPGGETVFEGPAGFYHAYAGSHTGVLRHSFDSESQANLLRITEGLGQRWEFLETLFRIYSTAGYNIAHVDVTAALCERHALRPEEVERVECVVNWHETQYPSPDFPSRRTDLAPGRETPHYYAAYAVLRRGFPVTKCVLRGVGEADPPGLIDMMGRIQILPSKTQPLFAPRVTITTRDGRVLVSQATGREFIMGYEQLASRLAPLAEVVPIGPTRYTQLVAACRELADAPGVGQLISLSQAVPTA